VIDKPLPNVVQLDLSLVESQRDNLPRLREFNPIEILDAEAGVGFEAF
jgi:hypothetical protein